MKAVLIPTLASNAFVPTVVAYLIETGGRCECRGVLVKYRTRVSNAPSPDENSNFPHLF